MLLDALVKFTPETHVDHENLGVALDKIKKITEYLNEAKRNAENVNKILDIENTVTGLNGSLLVLGRKFVKEGNSIEERKGGSRTVLLYLFNDMLILCKVVKKLKRQGALGAIDKQYQVLRHVPLPDVQSVHVPDEDTKSAKLLIQCKPDGDWNGNILLTFTTSEERDTWMNSISQARNSALAKVLRDRRASTVLTQDRSLSPSPSRSNLGASAHTRAGSTTDAQAAVPPTRSASTTEVPTSPARSNSTTDNPQAGVSQALSAPAVVTQPQSFAALPQQSITAAPLVPLVPMAPMVPLDANQVQAMQAQLQAQIQTMAHMLAMMQMQQAASPTPEGQAQQAQLLQMMATTMAMTGMPTTPQQPQSPSQPFLPTMQPPPGQ